MFTFCKRYQPTLIWRLFLCPYTKRRRFLCMSMGHRCTFELLVLSYVTSSLRTKLCEQKCWEKLLWKPDFIVENLKTEDIFSKLESFPGAQGPLLNVCFVLTQCGHFCGVWNFFGWSSLLLTTLSCSLSLKTSRHCEKWGWVKVRHAVVCIRVWKISESDSDFSCFTNTHTHIFF